MSTKAKTRRFVKDLSADNPVTRWNATNELRDLASDTEAMQALSAVLERDENPFVRSNAAKALRIGAKAARVLPTLIEALSDEDKDVRVSTLLTLQCIGDSAQGAVPAILDCLRDHEWEVRFFSAHLLGRLAPQNFDARKQLNKLLRDPIDLVASAAREALTGRSQVQDPL